MQRFTAKQDRPCAIPPEDLSGFFWPLQIMDIEDIQGLELAARLGDWQAIKQALIAHIEQAIPA